MRLMLIKNVYCQFHGSKTIALVLAKSEESDLYVLTAVDESAENLANYGAIGQVVDVEESQLPDKLVGLFPNCVQTYQAELGLTSDDCRVLFGKVQSLDTPQSR